MRLTSRLMLCFVLAPAILVSSGHAQEWTRFRGTDATGLSTDTFPATWTDKDFAWKVTLPGGGHSSPVLWGDKIFLTCGDDHTAERIVVCLSARDGSVIWKRDFDSHTFHQHQENSYASSTPAVDADHVYVCWTTPEELTLIALDHNGRDAWKAGLGPFVSQHGGGQSPAVAGDVVLLEDVQEGPTSYLFGVDRKTGVIRWRTPRARSDKFCPSTPCVYQPKEGPLQAIFLSKMDGVTSVDPQTGKVLWQVKNVFDARTVCSPYLADGLVVGSCGDGPFGHQLAAVRPPTDEKPAQEVWHTTDATPYVPTTVAKNGLLFCWGESGLITCRKLETGKIVWQQRVPGSFFSSPICAGDTIFNLSKKGEVVAIAAKDKFELLGKTPLNEKTDATPAIVDGRMYVRTYTHLYCVIGKKN